MCKIFSVLLYGNGVLRIVSMHTELILVWPREVCALPRYTISFTYILRQSSRAHILLLITCLCKTCKFWLLYQNMTSRSGYRLENSYTIWPTQCISNTFLKSKSPSLESGLRNIVLDSFGEAMKMLKKWTTYKVGGLINKYLEH